MRSMHRGRRGLALGGVRAVAALLVLGLATGCVNSSRPGATSSPTAPADFASAEEAWQRAAIKDYTLDVTITGCMACADPLRYSVTVADGEVADRTVPQDLGVRHGQAPTVEDLFHTIRWYQRNGADVDRMVTYNQVGVPVEMDLNVPNMTDVQAHYSVIFAQT